MSNRAATVIEDLPVELWREIFEYFNLFDLWFSFRGLNRRIDAIIDQTPLDLKLRRQGTYARFTRNVLPTMNATNVANIRSLSLYPTNHIKHVSPFYPLTSLIQLHSLDLADMFPFDEPTFQSWKQLSSLKHLWSLNINFSSNSNHKACFEEKEFLIRSIFEPGFYPALKAFAIGTCGFSKWKCTIPSLNPTAKAINLRYLSIDKLTFDDLVKMLPALENIESLRIADELTTSRKSTKTPPKSDKPLLPECLKLQVNLGELTFEHVEYLLRQTPNLKSLFLWDWGHFTDAKKWELLLSSHCPQLMKLELICTGHLWDKYYDEPIKQFKKECRASSFWQQRKVEFTSHDDRSGHDYYSDLFVRFNPRKK